MKQNFLKNIKTTLFASLLLFSSISVTLAANCGPQHEEMLDTAVRINTSGSGTVLYSKQHEGKWE